MFIQLIYAPQKMFSIWANLPAPAVADGAVRTVGAAGMPGSVVGMNKIFRPLGPWPVAMVI